jgi:hypothetical protein
LTTEFFDKYPILGIKYQDYLDFCKVVRLMQTQAHLSLPGVEEILTIKRGMNRVLCVNLDRGSNTKRASLGRPNISYF